MRNDPNREKDADLVKLALGLQAGKGERQAYPSPSEEELILLSEGKLDVTRRAQILDVLSLDKTQFDRWVSMIDTLETVNELPGASFSASQEISSRDAAASGFRDTWRRFSTWLMGGGLAACATVLVVVALVKDPSPGFGTDELYDHYASELQDVPVSTLFGSESISLRGGNAKGESQLTPYEYEILRGVIEGLEQLGMDTNSLSLPQRDTSATPVLEQERKSLLNLVGKTAILMHAKCEVGASDAFYEESHSIVEKLQEALSKIDSADMKSLSRKAPKGSSYEQQVCFFANRTVRRVIPNV